MFEGRRYWRDEQHFIGMCATVHGAVHFYERGNMKLFERRKTVDQVVSSIVKMVNQLEEVSEQAEADVYDQQEIVNKATDTIEDLSRQIERSNKIKEKLNNILS